MGIWDRPVYASGFSMERTQPVGIVTNSERIVAGRAPSTSREKVFECIFGGFLEGSTIHHSPSRCGGTIP